MSRSQVLRHLFLDLPIVVLIVAFVVYQSQPTSSLLSWTTKGGDAAAQMPSASSSSSSTITTTQAPVYFFSHGGPDVQYNTKHPAYAVLQSIGKEITQKVKPKAVVVFSAHWQATSNEIHLNNAEDTDLIYDFYGFPAKFYQAKYPSKGDPQLAARILSLLSSAGIFARGLKRGLDHGVFSGFNVAFSPEENPLNVPLVQVSLFKNEDPDAHYRLGRAVASLRDENIVIICTGMSVHNLRDMSLDPQPLPYAVSFDHALKEAVESPPEVRQERMAALTTRRDAKQAHPWMDHLMPVYVAAGAAGNDFGKQTWTMQEGSFAWAQYRFGDVPS
ncbi:Extradiol ring-cleavage dioxygenase, class III enzyme, subunit B [Cercophora scortea]|uniref:Extradiol ring-cleavage dioxygenase, class III enzyme, subunit B n=1 Tax=Cercophora scortea TaxID=314031 RepID=A0AAE0MLC5_9PEZI|nr:Extradiol ring-cleavage dioxygenase, class III enzyme, subunit B [Cercophora scortea]